MKTATLTALCTSGSVGDCDPDHPSVWDPISDGALKLNYGANGRVAEQLGRDTSSITTRYTQDGKPKQVVDSTNSVTVTSGFYLDGSVRSVDDGSNENTYAYDAGGQVTLRTDKTAAGGVTNGSTVSTSYSYNQAGLPGQMVSQVLGVTTAYEYDHAGLLEKETTGTHVNEMSYHPNNAVAGMRTLAGGKTINDFTYRYDNNGHITKQVAAGNPVDSPSNEAEKYTNTYKYNPAGNLVEWDHDPTGGVGQTTTYEWDRNNNRTKGIFDPDDQPAQETTTSYRMDNSINAVDLPTEAPKTFDYDEGGRLTKDDCNTYTYDDFDRVKTSVISNASWCGSDSRTVTYTYDGLDRQRTIAVTGSTSGNGTTSSIFNGLTSTLVGQKDAVNGVNSKPEVLYQLDASGVAMGMEQTGAGALKSFLDTDGHGNVVNQVTTGDARACAVVYDPFGNSAAPTVSGGNGMCAAAPPATTAATTTGNALWYRGQSRDASTGDYQLGTRSYDPATGAFTTPDAYRVATSATDVSVGVDPVTANTYSYVNGNPVNYSDPSGHMFADSGGGCSKKCEEVSATQAAKDAAASKEAELKSAQAVAAEGFNLEGAVKEFVGEVSGFNDFQGCLFEGDVGRCISLGISIVGAAFWKAGKVIKGVKKLFDAYQDFKGLKAARMLRVDELAKETADLNAMVAASVKADKARAAAAKAEKAADAQKASKAEDAASASKSTKSSHVGEACGMRSFSGDTLVLMGDGTRKPISQIKVGDKVLAADPETGKSGVREVTALWVHQDTLTDLVVDGETIRTTEDHPFWSVTDQMYEDAQDLAPGEQVLTADGRVIEVIGLDTSSAGEGTAYNLTVDDIHTYYVGHADVLVHNTNATPGGCGSGSTHADFVTSADGVTVPTSRDRLQAGFEDAGFPSTPTTSPGTQYTLPDGSLVRIMEPSGPAPLRASFTNTNGGPISAFTGKPVHPPAGLTKSDRLDYIRSRTHVNLEP